MSTMALAPVGAAAINRAVWDSVAVGSEDGALAQERNEAKENWSALWSDPTERDTTGLLGPMRRRLVVTSSEVDRECSSFQVQASGTQCLAVKSSTRQEGT